MPFNKKHSVEVTPDEESVGYIAGLEPRPAPPYVDVRELPSGITLARLANGMYVREDCQHWVRDPFGLKPNCRYDCPTPAEMDRQIIGRLQGVL